MIRPKHQKHNIVFIFFAWLLSQVLIIPAGGYGPGNTFCHRLPREQFVMLSPRMNIDGLPLPKAFSVVLLPEGVEGESSQAYAEQTVSGSRGTFYVQDEDIKKLFESIREGDEVHLIAPGGGGDALGAILTISILKRMLFLRGIDCQKVIFKLFVPNVKYGRENPWSGTVKMEYILEEQLNDDGTVRAQPLTPVKLPGGQETAFYHINGRLRVTIPLAIQRGERSDPILLHGKPVTYRTRWSEGEIVDLARAQGIEMFLMDFDRPLDVSRDYKKLQQEVTDRGKGIYAFLLDMGGDFFLQAPSPIDSPEHLESNIASPISDVTGLVLFDDMPALCLGLGGDGEMRHAIGAYLPEYFREGSVAGIFDALQFLQKEQILIQDSSAAALPPDESTILEAMEEYEKEIHSEVSANYLRRLRAGVREGWGSLMTKFAGGPWEHEKLLRRIEESASEFQDTQVQQGLRELKLRWGSREEYMTGYYLPMLVIRSTKDILNKIRNKELLDPQLTFAERNEKFIALGYVTEKSTAILYRPQIKVFSRVLKNIYFNGLSQEEAGQAEEITAAYESIAKLMFDPEVDLSLRLAAIRAVSLYELEQQRRIRKSGSAPGGFNQISWHRRRALITRMQQALDELFRQREFDMFTVSEVIKTIGIVAVALDSEMFPREEVRKRVAMLIEFAKDPEHFGKPLEVSFYTQRYALARARAVAERTICQIIRWELVNFGQRDASSDFQVWEKAWYGYKTPHDGMHDDFKRLKARLILQEIHLTLLSRGVEAAKNDLDEYQAVIDEILAMSPRTMDDKEDMQKIKEVFELLQKEITRQDVESIEATQVLYEKLPRRQGAAREELPLLESL